MPHNRTEPVLTVFKPGMELPGHRCRVLTLSHSQPLAIGTYRFVFQHPQHSDRLVKVLRYGKKKKRAAWYKALWGGDRTYRTLFREIKEYESLKRRNLHELPFIQKYFGEVETDLGLGIVVEKLQGEGGNLAPTVIDIIRKEGFSDALREKLIRLRDDIVDNHIVFSDIRGKNIVLARDPNGERLVVVDGLGDKLLISISGMSAQINRLNRLRHFEKAFVEFEGLDRQRAGGKNAV